MAGTLAPVEPPTSTLRPWFRRGPIGNLREELEDLFSNFLSDSGDGWLSGRVAPNLDLSETDGTVEVRMEIPGAKAEDIEIQIQGDALRISGEKKAEKEEKGKTFHRVERRYGSFMRTVALPCSVKEDKVDAQYRDGVLTVCMPKCEESKSKKIKVKA